MSSKKGWMKFDKLHSMLREFPGFLKPVVRTNQGPGGEATLVGYGCFYESVRDDDLFVIFDWIIVVFIVLIYIIIRHVVGGRFIQVFF